MIDLNLFFGSSRDVAMATNFGQNWQNDLHPTGWHSETGRNMAVLIKKYSTLGAIVATSCASLVKISPITPKIVKVTTTFLDKTAKIGIYR